MIKVYVILALVALAILVIVNFIVFSEGNTLVFVTIFFRHGHKSLTFNYTYKNDPNLEASLNAYPPGQLTLEGKKYMYTVGESLRLRYNNFLGDLYTKDLVKARSSEFKRTQESLQSVLAALFPQGELNVTGNDQKWEQPEYEFIRFEEDDMIAFWGKCTEYLKYDEQLFFQSEQVKKINEEHKQDIEYISENTGENVTGVYDLGFFYNSFRFQESLGLNLPDWTTKVYPETFALFAKEHWKATVSTFNGIKYSSGRLLKTISDTMLDKIKEKLPKDQKMNIFAGHDYGVCGILAALNIPHDYTLPYGSYVIIELHLISGVYGVKVYYQDYKESEPVLRTIGNCTTFCPIEEFVRITKKYRPDPNICLDEKSLRDLQIIL